MPPSNRATRDVAELQTSMIHEMREQGFLTSDRVAEAFAAVPRHVFTPEVSAEQAYNGFDIVRTRYGQDGAVLSSVSAPSVQAMMLEQAQLEPGHRVLEVGSGGYNAALAAELVGHAGSVTTVDLDPEITDRASRLLDEAGYGRVTVTCRDAEHGVPDHGPYDRILVTAGAWDVPPAWAEQLARGGRLVVPLRLRGLTRSIALQHTEQGWSSRDYQLCGFVPIQGAGAHAEARLELAPGVRLYLDDHQEQLDTEGLCAALAHPAAQHWTGLTVAGYEPFDELYLWLATQLDGFARLYADQDAIEAGLVDRWTRYGAATLAVGDSLAYLAPLQPTGDSARHEFGIRAHGPHGIQLAATMTAYAQRWHYHRGHHAHIAVSPADPAQPLQRSGTRTVHKRHTSVLITWPSASPQPAP